MDRTQPSQKLFILLLPHPPIARSLTFEAAAAAALKSPASGQRVGKRTTTTTLALPLCVRCPLAAAEWLERRRSWRFQQQQQGVLYTPAAAAAAATLIAFPSPAAVAAKLRFLQLPKCSLAGLSSRALTPATVTGRISSLLGRRRTVVTFLLAARRTTELGTRLCVSSN